MTGWRLSAGVFLVAAAMGLGATTAPSTHHLAGKALSPTLAVNPSAPKVGDSLVFTGCGYLPNVGVTIVIFSPYAMSFSGTTADASGCINSSNWGYTALQAGSYTTKIWESTDNTHQHNPDAQLTFTVS